jgi:hypothetical protein
MTAKSIRIVVNINLFFAIVKEMQNAKKPDFSEKSGFLAIKCRFIQEISVFND